MPSLVKLIITAQLYLMIMSEWIYEHQVFGGAYITIQCTFFDACVFNSFAASNWSTTSASTFCRCEAEKHCAYEECIWEVEDSSFTP